MTEHTEYDNATTINDIRISLTIRELAKDYGEDEGWQEEPFNVGMIGRLYEATGRDGVDFSAAKLLWRLLPERLALYDGEEFDRDDYDPDEWWLVVVVRAVRFESGGEICELDVSSPTPDELRRLRAFVAALPRVQYSRDQVKRVGGLGSYT